MENEEQTGRSLTTEDTEVHRGRGDPLPGQKADRKGINRQGAKSAKKSFARAESRSEEVLPQSTQRYAEEEAILCEARKPWISDQRSEALRRPSAGGSSLCISRRDSARRSPFAGVPARPPASSLRPPVGPTGASPALRPCQRQGATERVRILGAGCADIASLIRPSLGSVCAMQLRRILLCTPTIPRRRAIRRFFCRSTSLTAFRPFDFAHGLSALPGFAMIIRFRVVGSRRRSVCGKTLGSRAAQIASLPL